VTSKAGALLGALLAGCSPGPPAPAGEGFDAIAFFSGRTHGEGVLKVVARDPVALRVDSVGRRTGRDALSLVQRIHEGDKPPRERTWRLRRDGPGRFGGGLSDARGTVSVVAQGRALAIAYTMHNGMTVEQRLLLRPGGRVVDNRMTIRLLGARIARIDEVIAKLD
jgi:hypothetical protein